LQKPEAARKNLKKVSDVNTEINKKKLGRYLPQVAKARQESQSDFTTRDALLHGGGITTTSLSQMASNVTAKTATSALETQIQAELKRQGL
jgi:predicted DNA repair protein MutK